MRPRRPAATMATMMHLINPESMPAIAVAVAGWLMVLAGVSKRLLTLRTPARCAACGRRRDARCCPCTGPRAPGDEIKQSFNDNFWLEDRGYYALALDGDKRPVDALTSNIGHLLWSGIVDDDRAEEVRAHVMGPRLFSGWGVRTMAE